ncbi:sigma-54-dependent transcriptional regulator [Halobacteriovorax sp.]|uniref:sigma-54-dependent transcriptional regulator n=1 Tax=Halobacteriovorax sp. TaxID=2020862 RepID=UPI003568C89D
MSKRILNFLVIEDDDLSRLNLVEALKSHGLVREARNSEEAIKLLNEEKFDLAWIDLDLEKDLAGLDLIPIVKSKRTYAVVLSGREEDTNIEEAYKRGCEDYLSKPFDKDSLNMILRKFRVLSKESVLRNFFANQYVTQDDKLIENLKVINEVITTNKPVFLKGATGTGKTLIAKLVHELIFEDDKSFIHLNCSEIPENLLEAELFGYEKGAFSGAETSKKGKFELADGGTLFLDEIATMPMVLQQKILRAIDEKSFYPLGSETLVKSDFRLVSATCEDLEDMVKNGSFREDLYFRIEGFNIDLPSLSKRREDIPLLIKHFLGKGKRRVVLNSEVKNILNSYSWPGNIRELRRVVEILQSKSHGVIGVQDLPSHIKGVCESEAVVTSIDNKLVHGSILTKMQLEYIQINGLKSFVEKVEEDALAIVLKENDEKVRKTLGVLKISNSAFYRISERRKDAGSE